MSIHRITRDEFDSLNIDKTGYYPERSWFKSSEVDIAGTVIKDPIDSDWSYVIVAKEEDGIYRYLSGNVDLPTQEVAEKKMCASMLVLNKNGSYQEPLYSELEDETLDRTPTVILSIDEQIKSFFKNNPEKMYDLSPRKFEELIAAILKDMGFDVELTKATRDGGRDIIAYIRNSVSSFLTHIECKKYAPDNKVGVGIIRGVIGVHHLRQAAKSVIVTTGYFSKDAIKEASKVESYLELKDFNSLKEWLQRY